MLSLKERIQIAALFTWGVGTFCAFIYILARGLQSVGGVL